MSKVQEAVNALISENVNRKAVIQSKVDALTAQAATEIASITQGTRKMITLEMAGDEDTQQYSELSQQVSRTREDHENTLGRISAYEKALQDNDSGLIVSKLPELLELDREQQLIKDKAFQIKISKQAEMQSQFETLGRELHNMKYEIRAEAQHAPSRGAYLMPLLKYLESRPIKFGHEFEYLELISRGESVEHLVEGPQPRWNIPQQEIYRPAEPVRKPGKAIPGKTMKMIPYGS